MDIASKSTLVSATAYLSKQDSVLNDVILGVGPCTIRPHNNYYQELVESIISQQLSVKAARSILGKFCTLFGKTFPGPEQILDISVEELRVAGLSNAKAAYVKDLAKHFHEGILDLDILNTLSNNEIIHELTKVKGIGEWTAHMFLMFAMGRLDILAYGDLGIKNGVRKLYGFEQLPTPQDLQQLAEKRGWHPYESVACWYIWQSLDNN